VVATLAELTEDALVKLLTEPEKRLGQAVRQAVWPWKASSLEDPSLQRSKPSPKKRWRSKTGARGLRSILEQSLIDTMYELPNCSNVEKVVVDESTIEENKPPLLVYREAAKKASIPTITTWRVMVETFGAIWRHSLTGSLTMSGQTPLACRTPRI
jgi:ATP-dependent Clp protease ATP-binding subunit ClpX